jgi:hypothetical protein
MAKDVRSGGKCGTKADRENRGRHDDNEIDSPQFSAGFLFADAPIGYIQSQKVIA